MKSCLYGKMIVKSASAAAAGRASLHYCPLAFIIITFRTITIM